MSASITIDRLLNLAPDSPDMVLDHLSRQPELASARDAHGYSLLHAAASYGHTALIDALISRYHVSPNITDEDNETPLFACEVPQVAQCLVSHGADVAWKNDEGQTASDKIQAEGDFPEVAAYLRSVSQSTGSSSTASAPTASAVNGDTNGVHPPPPLPPNVNIEIGTMQELPMEGEQAPDPEFRRRIEELAAREDFQSEEGQRELRNLVTEAVTGLHTPSDGEHMRQRRRLD